MSAVRYFDELPHIIRYGMQDDQKQKSSMTFWRCGVGFEIEVDHEDVRGTLFSKTWLEYLKEPSHFDPPLEGKQGVNRWEDLCDCILTQCMPMLVDLAPSPSRWVTLNDYLHTPSYKLRMVTSDASKDAVPEIVNGPKDIPSYEHWPTAVANIKHLNRDAPLTNAEHLVDVNQGVNWRCPPEKVQVSDGRVFTFKACEKTSRYMGEGKGVALVNDSLDTINVYARLYKKTPLDIYIPRMEGIVVTQPSLDIKDSSPDADWSENPRSNYHSQQRTDGDLVAGILLTYLDNAKTLAEVLEPEGQKPTADQGEKWKKQVAEAIAFLHGQYITIGGRGGKHAWNYVNQYTVMISGNGSSTDTDAWLSLSAGCTSHEPEELDGVSDAQKKFDEEKAMDLQGLEQTFDF
jgi:hypothetical protein